MPLPAIRQPVILEGLRGSQAAEQGKNYRLLVDLAQMEQKSGHRLYFSDSTDYRILLRGAKTQKTSDGKIIGEVDPLEVKFDGGFLDVEDEETIRLLDKNPARGREFFTYDDVKAMHDEATEKKLDEVLSAISPDSVEKLKQRLDAKSFNLGKKSK